MAEDQIRNPDALIIPKGWGDRDPTRVLAEFGGYFPGKQLHFTNLYGQCTFARPDRANLCYNKDHPTAPGAERYQWFIVEKTPQGWLITGAVDSWADHANRFMFGFVYDTAEAAQAAALEQANKQREALDRHREAMKDPKMLELLTGAGALVRIPVPESVDPAKIPQDFDPNEPA